ncbi:hypothetical protein G9A89_013751 [Geosiphon pyriformis]|nr:hypothetical protein G9A89_013751 [Geosiphon pyriformis]
MEEECLIEKTSFDYGKGSALTEGDHDQTPMGIKVKTKKALGKPLGKIDFLLDKDDDDVLLNTLLALPTSVKKLIAVSIHKSFALDIGLDKITGKSSQEKLVVVRKLFSRINGFGGASTPSKFAGIIWTIFTSESSLVKTIKMTTDANIMVNTDLKKSAGHSDRAVVLKKISIGMSAEAVHAALSKFGIIKLIKIQLVGLWQKAVVEFEQSGHADLVAAKWSILIRKDAMAKCVVICFNSAELLDAIVGTTPVLRGTNLHWSCFVLAKCAKCGKSGHTLLGCEVGGKVFSDLSLRRALSDTDKSRLAAIYAKRSAPVARPVFFGGLSWTKIASGSSFSPLSG